MRYWLYKCNSKEGGPAGYRGDWASEVFDKPKTTQWGGSYSTLSPEVLHHLDYTVAPKDLVVAYQTDTHAVVGICLITKIDGPPGDRKLYLKPVERLHPPFRIHDHKRGTALERSPAVNGPVMLRELRRAEMEALVALAGARSACSRAKP
jgi:hypothetical protein